MATTQVVKSVCGLCLAGCGVLVTLRGGKAVDIKGDPEGLRNQGDLCPIGRASLEYLYHPDRLAYPLRRAGRRGDGKWQQISWDEAFNLAAEALDKVKLEYGPEAVVMVHGSAKGPIDTHLVRLANAFGTPNVICSDYVCHVPRMLAAELTFGFFPSADYGYPPACVISWGANDAETHFLRHKDLVQAVDKGAKLIAIDPRETKVTRMAELWLRIRPGSDLALALAMINVIINEGLYDKDFVDTWTVGFDKLKTHVQDYPADKVAEITWIPADLIVKAARLYATNRPGHIEWGNALDHNLNSFQTSRAISILMAITGNLGVPGGEIESCGSGFGFGDTESSESGVLGRWSAQLELRHKIPREERQNKIGADLDMLPDFRYVLPQSFVKSVLEGDPYHIHAAFVQGCNPLSSWPNSQEAYRALKKLDFLAVSDMFMTPTAALADVVFPAASYLEYDGIQMPPNGAVVQFQRKVAQIGECRSDHEIINGLAKKLGLQEYFWDNIEDFWDAILEPVGLTFNEFKKIGLFTRKEEQPGHYRRYEQNGFRTPSGKVELYSERLKEWGFDPLPTYHEPPEAPYSDPELAKEYPLIFITWKRKPYRHSGGRQIASLRGRHPEPIVMIHPETADWLGIKKGDWVYIETSRGRIKQKAVLTTTIDPRVVGVDYGWWFPEKGVSELYGWAESNVNMLTNDKPPFNREMGSASLRGFLCRVCKV
ncbi:MAG: molybdopterin-containing oxidoreductase family protein [Chloroflexota bacterium]